jgi:acid phosphatase
MTEVPRKASMYVSPQVYKFNQSLLARFPPPLSLLEMYLPLASSILHLLQLPLSLSDSDQSTLHSVASDEHFGDHHHRKDLNNLGNLAPYHDAPTAHRVSADLPDDCTVDQVILVSSQPGNEPMP